MKQLLYKECCLVAHPTVFFFFCLSAMVLIPNYPYYTVFFYTSLGLFFTCLNGREQQDIPYTTALPVRKRDAVKARFLFFLVVEGIQLLLCTLFSLLRQTLSIPNNLVGIEANPAFFGFSLLLLGLFHLTFFTVYYRNPDQVGRAFVCSSVTIWVYILLAEACIHAIPLFRARLDTYNPEDLGLQCLVLLFGGLAYLLLTVVSYQRSVRTFEALDL